MNKPIYITGLVCNVVIMLYLYFKKSKYRITNEGVIFITMWSWMGTFLLLYRYLTIKHKDKKMSEKENVANKVYLRFCKDKAERVHEVEMEKLIHIIDNKNAAHEIYKRYGVDIKGGKNYNEQILEIQEIIKK